MTDKPNDPNEARNRRRQSELALDRIIYRLTMKAAELLDTIAAKSVESVDADEVAVLMKMLGQARDLQMAMRWSKNLELAILKNPSLLAQTPGDAALTRKLGCIAARTLKAATKVDRRTVAEKNKARAMGMLAMNDGPTEE